MMQRSDARRDSHTKDTEHLVLGASGQERTFTVPRGTGEQSLVHLRELEQLSARRLRIPEGYSLVSSSGEEDATGQRMPVHTQQTLLTGLNAKLRLSHKPIRQHVSAFMGEWKTNRIPTLLMSEVKPPSGKR